MCFHVCEPCRTLLSLFAQEAVTAAAHMLRGLQTHTITFPSRSIQMQSRGAHILPYDSTVTQGGTAAIGVAAAHGILKCLRYELPILTASCIDVDPAMGTTLTMPSGIGFTTSDGGPTNGSR